MNIYYENMQENITCIILTLIIIELYSCNTIFPNYKTLTKVVLKMLIYFLMCDTNNCEQMEYHLCDSA